MQHVPDSALVEQLIAGDESALAALYDRYSGMLFAMLVRVLSDPPAAEEVLQDVFLQLWRTPARFDPARGSLAVWLMVIGRNRAISRLRSRSRAGLIEDLDGPAAAAVAAAVSVEDDAQRALLMERLRKAMAGLPPEQRQALELAYFEGMTHTEIAARTGSPLGTVKSRVRTAMQSLKELFNHGSARQPGRS